MNLIGIHCRIVFLSLFSVVILSACSFKSVELKEISNIEIQNIQNNVVTVKISAILENPNPRLVVKESDMKFYLNNTELGNAILSDKVILEGKSSKKYTAKVRLEFTNLKNGIFSALSLLNGKKQNLKISGNIKVSSFMYQKNFHIKDYAVKF